MAFLYIIALIAAFYFYKTVFSKSKINDGKQLPVAPGGIPFFGHIFLLGKDMQKKFVEWGEKCGEIFVVHFGPTRWIILNNPKVIDELLQKRSAIYSSRPYNHLFNVSARDRSIIFSQYNKWYRKMMPIVHGFLTKQKVESYSNHIAECTHNLIFKILKDTNESEGIDLSNYLRFTSFNIIFNVLFGIKLENFEDPLYIKLDRLFTTYVKRVNLKNLFPSQYPILFWFPPFRSELAKTLRLREEWEAVTRSLLKTLNNDPEKKPSVAQEFLRKQNEGLIEELDVIKLCEDFFLAGTETVGTTMYWLIANLGNHPEFQQKAHEELDRVVGHERLPTTSDFSSLLYIQSFIKETLRWAPMIPITFRYLEQDDTYMGYQIPKNSIIVSNIYALNSDKNRYDKPHIFNPDRFMNSKESFAISAKGSYQNRDHYTFSVGRRICTGIYLAEVELLYLTSTLLWAFKFENPNQDATGKSIPIDTGTSPESYLQHINPYKVRIIPRHPETEAMLLSKINQGQT